MAAQERVGTYDLGTLVGGESVGAGAIEIIRIPHEDALGDRTLGDDPLGSGIAETRALLHDIHHVADSLRTSLPDSRELCVEVMWRSKAVDNQPHTASIELHLVLRAVAPAPDALVATLRELEALLIASLSSSGYDFAVVHADALREEQATARTLALVKEEWLEPTGTQAVPAIFAYDRVPVSDRDLSRIANCLVEYPGTSVAFQVLPTVMSPQEKLSLERVTQTLGTLARGVADQVAGNVSLHAASTRVSTFEYYADHKDAPLFLMNVLVRGDEQAVPVVAARVHSHLASSESGGAFGARFIDVTNFMGSVAHKPLALPWRLSEHLIEDTRDAALWANPAVDGDLYRLPWLLTAEEVSQVFRLPIASRRLGAGFEVNHTERASRNYSRGVVGSSEVPVGHLKGAAKSVSIGFSKADLTKHMLVVGTPGSGKTTFNLGMLDRLWHEHGIPFLVIEPAKTEYRALVDTIPDLQIFTPGKTHISPFVSNPFLPPDNVRLEAYKSSLRTAFAAGLTMTSPLDRIFDDAVNRAYSRYGWMDNFTAADGGTVFSIMDFVEVFRQTVDRIGYTGEALNIGRAGVVRLQSLIGLFDTEQRIPVADLLQRPTVIELAAVENVEQKALVIAMTLLDVLAHVNANVAGDAELKHVIVLEEAHVLLDAQERPGSSGDADPTAIAKALVKRMLAEIRAYGVALVIADQSPRKVSADVVGLTNLKLGFRLVEDEDRRIFASSTNMSASQRERLGRLAPGQGFLFYDQLEVPEEVVTPDSRAERGFRVFIPDDEIAARSRYWLQHPELLVPFAMCAELSDWDAARYPLARELARRMFDEHFVPDDADPGQLESLFRRFNSHAREALRGSHIYDATLASMTMLYLLRLVKGQTRIPLSDERIRATLRAQRGTT